jgi:two-component system cell cycle response regulator
MFENPSPTPRSDEEDDRPTVLVVEDQAQNAELLQAYLETLPATVVTAGDGVEAMELVRGRRPDLIVLDVMMPRMSGFQVCRRLKADPATRDIPVLMVTALDGVGDEDEAREAGTDAFVTKPVSRFELLTRVKFLLR